MALSRRIRPQDGQASRSRLAATPSLASSRTTPIPTTGRLEMLFHEQTSLVKNAQEGLEQSMDVMIKTFRSQDNREGARLQVESLMNRAKELFVMFQVVSQIRRELIYVQEEMNEAKRLHKKSADLQERLHWLEQRLERLLLMHKRGRPAARGRRIVPNQTSFHARGRLRGATIQGYQNKPAQSDQPSVQSTKSTMGMNSSSPWSRSLVTARSQETSPSHLAGRKPGTSLPSGSRDSDVWHSESEANWTIMDAYSTQHKDAIQSQVLSSTDTPCQHQTALSEPSQHVDKPTTASSEYVDKSMMEPFRSASGHSLGTDLLSSSSSCGDVFEPPRSMDVFGDCSWNSLSLARNTNHVREGQAHQRSVVDGLFSMLQEGKVTEAMMQIGLQAFCDEISSLRLLIHSAAKAATKPGLAFPSIEGHLRDVKSFRRRSATVPASLDLQHKASHPVKFQPQVTLTLPSLSGIPSSDIVAPSRRLYGKGNIKQYPRSSQQWCSSSVQLHRASQSVTSSELTECDHVSSSRSRSMKATDTSRRVSTAVGNVKMRDESDPFDRAHYREGYIKHLLSKADSPAVETRRDAVQALGCLLVSTPQVHDKLMTKIVHDIDCSVKYESLKSLLHLGEINETVLLYLCFFLAEASSQIQSDLLLLMCKDTVLNAISQPVSSSALSGRLPSVLYKLTESETPDVCFPAVVALSHLKAEQGYCIEKLTLALDHPNPHYQSLALASLVHCWQCHTLDTITAALRQARGCQNWKLRLSAIEVLHTVGPALLQHDPHAGGESTLDILMERLRCDPVQAVKVAVCKLLETLKLNTKAHKILMGKLESSNEVDRKESVAALAAFDLKQYSGTARALLDLLDLDPSTAVRLQVVKLFAQVKCHHPAVIQAIQAKSKGSGAVARECFFALSSLEAKGED